MSFWRLCSPSCQKGLMRRVTEYWQLCSVVCKMQMSTHDEKHNKSGQNHSLSIIFVVVLALHDKLLGCTSTETSTWSITGPKKAITCVLVRLKAPQMGNWTPEVEGYSSFAPPMHPFEIVFFFYLGSHTLRYRLHYLIAKLISIRAGGREREVKQDGFQGKKRFFDLHYH